jgi:hypothetical protein
MNLRFVSKELGFVAVIHGFCPFFHALNLLSITSKGARSDLTAFTSGLLTLLRPSLDV